MRQKDVEIGGCYLAKVSGRVVVVKVLAVDEHTDWKGRTRRTWRCRNEATGRVITVRSAQRFRSVAEAGACGASGS